MKKTILALALGVLLIAGNLYAGDGDLYVDGKVGIGTTTPSAKLDVKGTAKFEKIGLTTNARYPLMLNQTVTTGPSAAGVYFSFIDDDGSGTDYKEEAIGHANVLVYRRPTSSNSDSSISAAQANALLGMTSGSGLTIDNIAGLKVFTGLHNNYNSNATLTKGYGIELIGLGRAGGEEASLTVDDYRHIYARNRGAVGGSRNATLTVNKQTGLWLDKQELGTTNYGIVLDGDGSGADIVFGPNQESRIYSEGGRLRVQDSSGNETIISPHDPVTGEWIYYSKNINTGVVKRVNMEELVKDIEKLTGKKYLIETFEEIE